MAMYRGAPPLGVQGWVRGIAFGSPRRGRNWADGAKIQVHWVQPWVQVLSPALTSRRPSGGGCGLRFWGAQSHRGCGAGDGWRRRNPVLPVTRAHGCGEFGIEDAGTGLFCGLCAWGCRPSECARFPALRNCLLWTILVMLVCAVGPTCRGPRHPVAFAVGRLEGTISSPTRLKTTHPLIHLEARRLTFCRCMGGRGRTTRG